MATVYKSQAVRSVDDARNIEDEMVRLSGDPRITVHEDADGVFSAILSNPTAVYNAFSNKGKSAYCATVNKEDRTVVLAIDPRRRPRWMAAAFFSVLAFAACIAVGWQISDRLSQ
jgi:hypothetical protein